MSQRFEVECNNKTSNTGSFCLFQRDPGIGDSSIYSVAWFVKRVGGQSKAAFSWTLNYCFVCGEIGQLRPGSNFEASQVTQADLTNGNQITLEYGGGFRFNRQERGRQSGSLTISEDSSIPMNRGAVGIGMSDVGIFVTQARPNMNLNFPTRPEYWVAFGNFTNGQVLDEQAVNNAARIEFPGGVFKMYAAINADGSWTVSK